MARIAHVDRVVRERGWSLDTIQKLADDLDCDVRTIYRYWSKARRWTQATLATGDLKRWRTEQVVALAEVARLARDEKEYSAATRAIEVQAKIIGTIAPTKVEMSGMVAHVPVLPTVRDAETGERRGLTVDEIEAEVERLRRAALAVDATGIPVLHDGDK